MNELMRDVRYGFRMLLSKPGFTISAILVLALGIGANSAVFSLINAFLLKPIHIERPEQLAGLFSRDTKHPDTYRGFSYPNYVDIRNANPVFSSLTAYSMAMVGVEEGATTRRAFSGVVSSSYFSTLGVSMLQGRAFSPEEEKANSGALPVVVTYPFWSRGGQDPQILGKQVRINGRMFTVVGITPKGFTGTTALVSPEIFVPLSAYNLVMNDFETQGRPLDTRENSALIVVGRLKPGVTQPAADAQMAVIASQMEKAYPAVNKDQSLIVRPLSRMSISTNPTDDKGLRVPAILLLSLAAVVLLIASLNLANMMMAKGAGRRKEIAIRLAIGGGRRQIVRQLVTEGLILAIAGGIVGMIVASWSTTLLVGSMARLAPIDLVYDATPDLRVVFATLGFCALSTVVFGLFPAWKLSKPDIWIDLKENTGEDIGGGARKLFSGRNILVMGQLALSLMMLTAAGLFVHSAIRAANIEPGFSMDNSILAEVDASLINYDEARGRQIYTNLKDRLQRMPGVESVALAATAPFGMMQLGKSISPSNAPKDAKPVGTRFNIVSEDYFKTLKIPLERGRAFTAAEAASGSKSHVAILDKLAASKLWPDGDAVGKHIRVDTGDPGGGHVGMSVDDDAPKQVRDLEVVGVVANVKERIIGGGDEPHLYIPWGQQYQSDLQIHLKLAAGGPDAEKRMLETVRSEIRAVDERLPLLLLKTMRGNVESSIDIWIVRTGAQVLEIFGGVALLLAMIGLYAVNAYTVARRTREIGIRMALGASAAAALKMVLREGLRITAVGVGVGLLLAIGLGQVLAGLLYDVRGFDPVVLALAPLVLAVVALGACYPPARKASQVDPMIALRYQ
jgi:predicted permease